MKPPKSATVAVFLCFVLGSAGAAATKQKHAPAATHKNRHSHVQNARTTHATVRQVASGTQVIRDRVIRLSTAIRDTELDCSHFTNFVYDRVGLDYDYTPSKELYKGSGPFVRVHRPMAGDLIVWRGHVGIIVDPDDHTFVSKLNSGVKVADWGTRYWKRRGIPRFFRFTGQLNPTPEADIAEVMAARTEESSSGASD
jgi:cell wall-associated NlpC family hydrolase